MMIDDSLFTNPFQRRHLSKVLRFHLERENYHESIRSCKDPSKNSRRFPANLPPGFSSGTSCPARLKTMPLLGSFAQGCRLPPRRKCGRPRQRIPELRVCRTLEYPILQLPVELGYRLS